MYGKYTFRKALCQKKKKIHFETNETKRSLNNKKNNGYYSQTD